MTQFISFPSSAVASWQLVAMRAELEKRILRSFVHPQFSDAVFKIRSPFAENFSHLRWVGHNVPIGCRLLDVCPFHSLTMPNRFITHITVIAFHKSPPLASECCGFRTTAVTASWIAMQREGFGDARGSHRRAVRRDPLSKKTQRP